jgi:hypothetical protein
MLSVLKSLFSLVTVPTVQSLVVSHGAAWTSTVLRPRLPVKKQREFYSKYNLVLIYNKFLWGRFPRHKLCLVLDESMPN